MQLQGKTVLVTGATGGIGQSIATALAQAGACVLLTGRDPQQLEFLRIMLPPVAVSHLAFVANLREGKEREALAQYCQEKQVDVLINSAGIGEFNLLESSDSERITDLLDINLQVPIQLTRLLLPHLRSRPAAAIVNIGSALGSIGYPAYSVYGASKFGLRGFSEALRRELSDTPVRVLHLAPRATRTPLNKAPVLALNAALGVAMDAPEVVAKMLLECVEGERWGCRVIGWPERLYAWLNGVWPGLTDSAVAKQLAQIKRFAQADTAADETAANS